MLKRVALAIPLALTAASTAAEESHALRGLFCRTEAQILATFDRMRGGFGPRLAVEIGNRDAVVCVYADRIDYVVVRPFIIGAIRHRGASLIRYEATLVGVRVGGALRPVEPAVRIFFVRPDRLADAIAIGGA
jgi:hypothetical protein